MINGTTITIPEDVNWGASLRFEGAESPPPFFEYLNKGILRLSITGTLGYCTQGTMWEKVLANGALRVRYLDSPYGNDHYYVSGNSGGIPVELYHCQSGNGKTVVFGFQKGGCWLDEITDSIEGLPSIGGGAE